jgi:hypothetical protein
MVVDPPLILLLDGLDARLGLTHAWHRNGFNALDIRRVKAIDRLLVLPLLAQSGHFFSNVHGRHDKILLD